MIKRLIMTNKIVGIMVVYFIKLLFKGLQIFIKVEPKTILITSFSGRKFDDSPRIIYEELKVDPDFKEYRFIWGFKKIREEFPTEQVQMGTFKYLLA